MIGSEATPDKNKISTGTLDYENIENEAHYEASSTGVQLGIRRGKIQGIAPNASIPVQGEAKSTTKSAIAEGKTEAGINQSETKNNWLKHEDQAEFAQRLAKAKTDEEKADIIAYYAALSQYNIDHSGPALEDIEAIEGTLYKQLEAVTSNLNGGLNYALNELTVNILGVYEQAANYRGMLESTGGRYKYPGPKLEDKINGGISDLLGPGREEGYRPNEGNKKEETKDPGKTEGNKIKEGGKIYEIINGEKVESEIKEGERFYVEGIGWYEIKGGKDSYVENNRIEGNKEWTIDEHGKDVYVKDTEYNYEGKSKEKQEILKKLENAASTSEQIKYCAQYLGEDWTERIEGYWKEQYENALSQGMGPELAETAADMTTGELLGNVIVGLVSKGEVIASDLGKLGDRLKNASRGSSNAELNVPGTKYYNPNYKANMSMEDMIWGAKESGKGLSTMGSATRAEAIEAGKSWVGPNYKTITNSTGEVIGYSSQDGMRAFRISYKPNEGITRANFQENTIQDAERFGKYQGATKIEIKNVHVDIIDWK